MKLARSFVAGVLSLCACHAIAQQRVWKFEVTLDDNPIGQHDFVLTGEGPRRELRSDARFDITLLFITAYRYRHQASETWNGNCLAQLAASTDDNGALSSVAGAGDDRRFTVRNAAGSSAHEGCVMSFAYWNPAILRQTRLLNPQTGRLETVSIRQMPDTQVALGQRSVPATHYRITGPTHPIDLWYSPDGDWLQLASTVKGGIRLLYRRKE
jgi:hypothetical protein